MNTTATLPVADTLESLEFEPMCEHRREWGGCDRPADWLGEQSCGCHAILLCTVHKESAQAQIAQFVAWDCTLCGAGTTVIWRRL